MVGKASTIIRSPSMMGHSGVWYTYCAYVRDSLGRRMSKQSEQKVGFIGLGALGRPMAENLVRAGFDVVVHNRSRDVVAALAAKGARTAETPMGVACEASVIFIMVRDEAQLRDVAFSST